MTTMARRWSEGDWIDFIILRFAPALGITLGGITLWALVVLVKAALAGG